MNKVYQIVTDKIIDKLNTNVIPWRKPWNSSAPINWNTCKPYNGINRLLLDSGEYATFKQISAAGGKIKKGEKGSIIVFYTSAKTEDCTDDAENNNTPIFRYYTVFEINIQCEGLTTKIIKNNNNTLILPDKIISKYIKMPNVIASRDDTKYSLTDDVIYIPDIKNFISTEEYYCSMFHEMIHSTAHKNRLDRKISSYAREELVAEIGAAMLCSISNIGFKTIDNSVAYIQYWVDNITDDNKMIVYAANKAQKAVDYILGKI